MCHRSRAVLFFFLFISLSAVSFTVSAGANEAGLITGISGEVYYGGGAQKKEKALPFMKTKVGDVFFVEHDSRLQLVFFKGGRRESWKGAVEIVISEDKSSASPSFDEDGALEHVSSTDGSSDGLRRIPEFIQKINTERAGSATLRGDETEEELKSRGLKHRRYEELNSFEKQKVKEARMIYDQLIKTSEPGDITPELYSIGVLSEFDLYEETYGLTKEALKKQPGNSGLMILKENLEAILNIGK